MYALLKQQQRTNKIPAAMPAGVHVANKTGELSNVENDAGILYDTLQIKWLKQCDRVQKLEKELVLGQTTCCTCWLKRICMKIRK